MDTYDVIRFSQYESDSTDDDLLLFAAPAKQIWKWAGIPRKGWNVRMLFQRWITPKRTQEVTAFWNYASTWSPAERVGKGYILGPTALTIAIFGAPDVKDGKITLEYEPPFQRTDDRTVKLSLAATTVTKRMYHRLTAEEKAILSVVESDPRGELPDLEQNYVLESLCQIAQAATDPEYFVDHYGLADRDCDELISSLEALCRPALVVDGQHRLYGAASATSTIWVPVVAVPNSPWSEGIYQFIVINEKAQRVDTDLLTDIFGSSLTPSEQKAIEVQLDKSQAGVQQRIAAVIAARDERSPFFGLVRFSLEGEKQGFIPTLTVRQLIDGGGRGSLSWRSDTEFYDTYVRPTFPVREEWDGWAEGKWKEYWFAFWTEVRDFYNSEAGELLWSKETQTNLTKAVALRLLQALFIKKAIERVCNVERTRDTLADLLKDAPKADAAIEEKVKEVAIPATVEEFRKQVRAEFLKKGIPVRVFERPWVKSLDDQQGQDNLFAEFEKAYDACQKGQRYRAQNKDVFAVPDDD
jgi:hypothetical protein